MAITVTATQGGTTGPGLALRVFVVTGAKVSGTQAGAAPNADRPATTAFTVAGTITATSSFVYGAAIHGTTSDTGSAPTVVAHILDSSNGARYCTFKQLAPSSGSQTLGVTASASDTGGVAWLEVQASGTLAEDVSSPAGASATGPGAATTGTTASFTPPPGSPPVAV